MDNNESVVKGRILIMDDDNVVSLVAQKLFGKIGLNSDCVSSGEEAIKKYKSAFECSECYDAVLMDLNISGGLGGLETVKIIKSIDPDAKVILFSGFSNHPVVNDYKEYGFSGVLRKPFSFDECIQLVNSISRK